MKSNFGTKRNPKNNPSRDFKIPASAPHKCSKCGVVKMRIRREFTDKNGIKPIYVDEENKIWCASVCNDCKNKRTVSHSRKKYGQKSIDDVSYHSTRVGRNSERIAEKYFKELGYEVQITKGSGPDLIIRHYDFIATIEVKTIITKNGIQPWTAPVSPNRTQDDFVCLVGKDKYIFLDTMENHLKNCSPNGSRFLTKVLTTRQERASKLKKRKTASGFKGVYFSKRSKKFRAYISDHISKKQKHLGHYETAEDAAKAYDKAAILRDGYDYAVLNFPDEK